MAVQSARATLPWSVSSRRELHKRRARWSFFQTFAGLTYAGVVADIITTALGVAKVGSKYEQNPIGGALIVHIGWIGIFLLVTMLSVVCYFSFRIVYWRMSTALSAIINPIIFFLATFRWLVVAVAISFLLNPTH